MIPKEILVVFHNGSNYDYHFIIKELTKGSEVEFNCLEENTGKCKTFSFPITKEVKRIDKNSDTTKTISSYLANYNLLIAQDLWQAHYQILLIILLKEFTKLNANVDMIIKNMKLAELNTNTASAALNTQTFKMI